MSARMIAAMMIGLVGLGTQTSTASASDLSRFLENSAISFNYSGGAAPGNYAAPYAPQPVAYPAPYPATCQPTYAAQPPYAAPYPAYPGYPVTTVPVAQPVVVPSPVYVAPTVGYNVRIGNPGYGYGGRPGYGYGHHSHHHHHH